MGFLSKLFGGGNNKTREEAQRLGISVADTQRDLPQFSHDMKSVELYTGNCVSYSIPRRGGQTSWQLLQRTKALGATMPNDYLLQSSGALPDALTSALRSIAEQYSEEYFEFEGNPTTVSVFWEEWGGPKQAQDLHARLVKLASL